MKRSIYLSFCFLFCIVLAGCATVGGGDTSAKADDGVKKFKKLSDEDALKTVVAIYNVKIDSPMDMTARNIAFDTYIGEIKKRRSKYLEDSGVFQLSYDQENIKKWTDRQIVETFRALETKTLEFEKAKAEDLTEEDRTMQLVRLTAMNAIYKEGAKRDLFRNIMEASMNALMIAASIAAAMI